MIKRIKEDLPFSAISILERALDIRRNKVSTLLAIPISTLTRRKRYEEIRMIESDKAVRFTRSYDETVDMFMGDQKAAVIWFKTTMELLHDNTPLERASNSLEASDVEDFIGLLRHGVFS